MLTFRAGATLSWATVASPGRDVSPAPPAAVAKTVSRLACSRSSGTASDARPELSASLWIGSGTPETKRSN